MGNKIVNKITGTLLIIVSAMVLVVLITLLLGLSVMYCKFMYQFGAFVAGWVIFLAWVIDIGSVYLLVCAFRDVVDGIVDRYF